jgi:hypothetical protein
VYAGLATVDGDHLLAVYDPALCRIALELRRDGRTRLLRRKRIELPDTFRLAFVVCENQATILVDDGTGWVALLTEREKVASSLDLRRPETLARLRYAWGTGEPATDTGPGTTAATAAKARITDVRAGLFGMTGLRDLHLVQHADGTPYLREGLAYLTATCAGMGFFRQAHWGVFTVDLSRPDRLQQVGQLFFERDGVVLGDHAGQVVRDDEHDRWIVATSSWGDFDFDGVHVRHTTTTDDVLHGVHVLKTVRTPLPTTVSAWDPGLTRIDGTWHVAFVESPSQAPFDFHPALATASGIDWCDDLTLVGAANDLHQCEGPILTQVEGTWWLLASDGDHRHYPVYTLDMRRAGRLDAPYPTNIPHPQLVPLPDGDWLMLTFEGTQFEEPVLGYGAHGDVVVMRTICTSHTRPRSKHSPVVEPVETE